MVLNNKENAGHKKKGLWKPLFVLCIFLAFVPITAQKYPPEYLKIIDSPKLSTSEKIKKVDSLLTIYKKESDRIGLASSLLDYGAFYYREFKDYPKAIDLTVQSLSLAKELEPLDIRLLWKCYFNLATYNEKSQKYSKAIHFFKKAFETIPEDKKSAESLSRIATSYMKLGDLYRAHQFHERAEARLLEIGFAHAYIIDRINASDVYRKLGQKNLTIKNVLGLKNCLRLNDSLKNKIDDSSYSLYRSLAHLLHGERDLDSLGNALDYYQKTLDIALKRNDTASISSIANSMGVFYRDEEKDMETALSFFQRALDHTPSRAELKATVYLNQAKTFLLQKNLDAALNHSEKAFWELLPGKSFENSTISDYGNIPQKVKILEILKTRTALWLQYHDEVQKPNYLERALKSSILADGLMEIIRQQSTETQSKYYWQQQASEIHSLGVQAAFALKDADQAHYFMERNKALVLQENLAYERQRSQINLPDSILSQEYELKRAIAQAERVLSAKDGNRDSLQEIWFTRKEAYQDFVGTLENQYPKIYTAKKAVKLASLNDFTQKGVLLEYLLPQKEDQKGYGLLYDGTKKVMFALPTMDSVMPKLRSYRQYLERPFVSETDKRQFIQLSKTLYDWLLPKAVHPYLKEKPLTIIPDGNLQHIPFEALVVSKTSERYLIQDHVIHYAYSLSSSRESQTLERKTAQSFAGFAPVQFGHSKLAPLTKSAEEIMAVQSIFKDGHFFTKLDASKKRFEEMATNTQILHLATHADAQDSIAPWIAFPNEKLTLFDLYPLKTPAELVVLSACNTSLGKVQDGEGVLSLARGFFNSGAGSVLSSLWTVNDGSGKQIMTQFYQNLQGGKSKSESLRLAKLDYLNAQSGSLTSPYYWAPYILIGDATPLQGTSSKNWWWFVLGLGMPLLFFGVSRYRKSKAT